MRKNLIFNNGDKIPIGNIFCIGSNYAEHIKEMGSALPVDPVIFFKPSSAYIQNGEKIKLPEISNLVHHEVELVIVIGDYCANVQKTDALDYIAGFAVGIDVTLRDLQKKAKSEGKPWGVAKGFYTSAPISDVIPFDKSKGDINFDIELRVNGELKQKVNTIKMQRNCQVLIEYLSKIFTLDRGDCIFTGTPEGVGAIKSGDKISASLSDLVTLNVYVE